MSTQNLAKQIIDLVGGENNIRGVASCMTRLRLNLKDFSQANVSELKKVSGVLGVVEADTLQVILGPGKVTKVAQEVASVAGVNVTEVDTIEAADLADQNKANVKASHQGPVQRFLGRIANIFVPLIPGIIAAGFLNGLTGLINFQTQGAYATEWWFQLLRAIGTGLFAILPILVGMNASKEFGGTPVLGAIAGLLATGAGTATTLGAEGVLMPITNAPYNAAAGGMIAALIAGIFFALIEKNIRKWMPDVLTTFFTPLLTVILGGVLMVLIFQPLGAFLTKAIFDGLFFFYDKMGVIGAYLLSALFLPLVSVGLHQALTPIHQLLNDPAGATQGINYLLPILMMAGGGQVGAGFALYLKSRNKRLKQLTRDSLPVGILGIGEPMMYAVTLPLGKPFITACLGAGFGGVVARLFELGAVSQGVSGLFGALIVQPGNQIQYFIAMFVAYVAGFVLTWFFGVDEKRATEVYE